MYMWIYVIPAADLYLCGHLGRGLLVLPDGFRDDRQVGVLGEAAEEVAGDRCEVRASVGQPLEDPAYSSMITV